jgi:hypothetical protein
MANERDIAILTDRVAQAMARARATLDNTADSLSDANFGRVMEYRLEDVENLATGAGRVQQAEFEAEVQGRVASRTQDRGDMERWSDADHQVRVSFNSAAQDAGDLGSGIGRVQRELSEFRDDLGRSAAGLEQALRDIDTLEQFPEYGRSESEGLRTRLSNLKNLTTQADAGLENAFNHLDNARTTANQLERTSLQVGEGRHSAAVRDTATSLTIDVNRTRDGLAGVREGIDRNMHDVHNMAQYGIDEANRAAELENAVRAGTNPPAHAEQSGDRAPEQESGNGVQDPRLRLMRGTADQGQGHQR